MSAPAAARSRSSTTSMKFVRRAVKCVDGSGLCCEREERVVSVDTIGGDVLQVVEQLKEDAIAEREALLVDGGVTRERNRCGKD